MIALTCIISVLWLCELSLGQLVGNGTIDDKNCTTGNIYDNDLSKCVKDCTNTPNSHFSFDPSITTQCLCIDNFEWRSSTSECVRNCKGVLNSKGIVSFTNIS